MKKIVTLAFLLATTLSQAVIFATGPFPTFPFWKETFDTTPAGSYTNLPVFSGLGLATPIGPGALAVAPFTLPFSPPNAMFGKGADVRIRLNAAMRRFGGWFESAPFGVNVTAVTFKFFTATNVPIGTATVPLTNTWTWIGYRTYPRWSRVEIYGNLSVQGFVAMDSLHIRFW